MMTTDHVYMLSGKNQCKDRDMSSRKKEKNNSENKFLQEAGWDGARIQVVDMQKDVFSSVMERWHEAEKR